MAHIRNLVLIDNLHVSASIVLFGAILATASRCLECRIALVGTVIVRQGSVVRRLDVLRVQLYLIESVLHWLCFVVESLVCVLGRLWDNSLGWVTSLSQRCLV